MNDHELEAMAAASEGDFQRRRRTIEDFRFDEQQEKYWDITTGVLLGPKAVDGAVHIDDWPRVPSGAKGEPKPIPPSKGINAIDTGLTVEGSTWWPGKGTFIKDTVVTERGAFRIDGAVCYNSYIGPVRPKANPKLKPDIWIDHVKKLFPDPVEHEHFFSFAAHMIQRPDQKVCHGVVIAGSQGIGKDTALLPLRHGVGEWNAAEVGPEAITGQYNGYIKSVLLIINEVKPHDEDFKASNFYNLLKPLLAAPPDMLPMTLKYANTIFIRNLCHVILTTNDPLSMYIPDEDRRLFVMNSKLPDPKKNPVFHKDYFCQIHTFFSEGGLDSVVNWLLNRDLSGYDPNNAPPVTVGKDEISNSAIQVRWSLIDELLTAYAEQFEGGKLPDVIFPLDLIHFISQSNSFDDADKTIGQIKAKNFHFKMSENGFSMIRNPKGTRWKNGDFATRNAFIRKEVPHEKVVDIICRELAKRPLKFDF